MKAVVTILLAIALAATTFAQRPVRPSIPGRPGTPVPSAAPASRPGVAPSVSRPSFPPTAKSDDLVESPATNVVKGAFGYTLGAIWEGPIPEDTEPDKNGEVSIPVEPKTQLPPFESVTLSISTNEHRIAAISAKTPRMMLAESYTETHEKADLIARTAVGEMGVGGFTYSVTMNRYAFSRPDYFVVSGKLYREFLKKHPDDPDYEQLKDISVWLLRSSVRLVAGSRYDETPAGTIVRPGGPPGTIVRPGRLRPNQQSPNQQKPDYLQQIWQPFELSAAYYPYAGDAVIRFSVRDVEDRTEHTNLVSVADVKKAKEEEEKIREEEEARKAKESAKKAAEKEQMAVRKAEESTRKAEMENARQDFKNSLYHLSFIEAVEKAKENDPEALLRIALAYADGTDIQEDWRKAREFIEKACEQNYGFAQYVYGLAYFHHCQRFRLRGLNDLCQIAPVYDLTKAAHYLEQAISNGVSFAQEDLEYVRGKLNAEAEEKARKEKNAELLKEATEEKPQEEETPADTCAEPETRVPQPARRTAPVRPARPAGDATNAPSRAPARSAAATVPSPARPAIRPAAQPTAGEPKEQTAAENKTERDQAFVRIKETLRRMPFEEAAEKSKGKDSEALLRVAFAFAEGKEVSKSAGDAYNYVLDASRLDYGIAHYLLGVSAGASMFKAWEGSNYCCERNARWREIIDQIGWPEDVRLFPRFDIKRSAPMGFDGERVLIGYRRDRDVTEEQRLEREKELAEKAVSSFEKAVSNGVSIAQEDLDFMRKELVEVSKELDDYRAEEERRKKDKELSDELKRKNEALLKGEAE